MEQPGRIEGLVGSTAAGVWRGGCCAAVTVTLLAVGMALGSGGGLDAAQPTEAAQDGFVPMGDIPPEDQLPAAPLLVAAYAVVWAIAIGYLWTIWRRLGSVERELAEVARRVGGREP